MIMGQNLRERISRMSPVARGLSTLAAVTLALFVLGFWIGFGAAALDHGHLLPRKPLGWVVVAIGLIVTIAVAQLLRVLLSASPVSGMTPFDQRYWKMWLWIGALGIPIGIGLVAIGLIDPGAGDSGRLFSADRIEPAVAAVTTAALLLALGLAAWLYHRTIDDHEELAYLWGSQIAYYFIAAAIPAWWLLSRGEIVPPLAAGPAVLLLLASFVVQAIVWAWFKFR